MEARLVNRSDSTVAYRITGQRYVVLGKGDDDGFVLVGDFTGDGRDDLLVELETLIETVKVYGPHSIPRLEFQLEARYNHPLLAEIDGDGQAELINLEGPLLAAYHYKEERTTVEGWPYERWVPTAAADLDGDGIDEIICIISEMTARAAADPAAGMFAGLDPEASDEERALWVAEHAGPRGGYFNPASGEVVEFEFPETNYRYNVYLGLPEEICAADIDGDGRPEVLARAAIGSHLLAFDARGALVYHEEFGTAVLGSGVAGCAAGDCVVLQLEDRLLCYP